jgi:DNA-binding CsgD family transcriptional regulator
MNTSHGPSEFLLAILEGFLDGILVLTDRKQLLYINNTARRLCQRLLTKNAGTSVPPAIWQMCESLMANQHVYPEKLMVMESEVEHEEKRLRIRVQSLLLDGVDRPCLIVRLQDQQQVVQTMAIAEAQKWQLTERESQVWLLRRAGSRRKQIAAELYISEDTVKKHLGNINAKRQSYLDEEEWHTHEQLRSA